MDGTQDYDMDSAIGYLLGHAYTRLRIGLRRQFVASGLDVTPEQWVVLFRLSQRQGLSQSELGERTVKDKTTVTRILDRLEKKGLVTRRRDVNDRRSQRIFLTDQGVTALDALMPLVRRYGAEVFADIGADDRETLLRLFRHIEARLDAVLGPGDLP